MVAFDFSRASVNQSEALFNLTGKKSERETEQLCLLRLIAWIFPQADVEIIEWVQL